MNHSENNTQVLYVQYNHSDKFDCDIEIFLEEKKNSNGKQKPYFVESTTKKS